MTDEKDNGPDAPHDPAHAAFLQHYDRLRAVARRALAAERTGHTLQTTALLHEAWIRGMAIRSWLGSWR